jgi:hypothetical protein
LNTNDISGSIHSAIYDADAYYVLSYYAPGGAGDGRYRKIDVKTTASGVERIAIVARDATSGTLGSVFVPANKVRDAR